MIDKPSQPLPQITFLTFDGCQAHFVGEQAERYAAEFQAWRQGRHRPSGEGPMNLNELSTMERKLADMTALAQRLTTELDKLRRQRDDLLEACRAIQASPYGVALGDLARLDAAIAQAEGKP